MHGPGKAPSGLSRLSGSLVFVVIATTLVQALSSMGLLSIAFMAPLVADDLGIPAAVIGFQVGFIYLWSMLASPLAGAIVTRFGAARASQLALVACSAGILCCATGNVPLMIVGSAIAGAGYSLGNPASSQILNALAPAGARNLLFALKQSGVPIGWALAGAVLPGTALMFGWQTAVVAVAIAMLMLAVVMVPAHRTWRDGTETMEAPPTLRSYFRLGFDGDRRLLAMAFVGLLYATVQIAVIAYMVTALVEAAAWTAVAAGTAVTVMQLSGAGGRLALAAIGDRFRAGLVTLAAAGFLSGLAALWCGAVLTGGDTWMVLAAVGVLGFFAMGWNGLMLAEVARMVPAWRVGAMTSRMMIYSYGGSVLGPWIFSLIYAKTLSYPAAYALVAVPAIAGAVCVLIAWADERRSTR